MKQWSRWAPVVVMMGVIYSLSAIPNLHLYREAWIPPFIIEWIHSHLHIYTWRIGETGFFSYMITNEPDYVLHKMGHITFYGILGVTFFYAFQRFNYAVICTMLFAFSDELHQYFVPGRSSRFGDVLLDTLAAILFIWLARTLLGKNHQK